METISIYKNMEVTYWELETALVALHYIKKRGKDFYGFENKTFDSVVLIPLTAQPGDKMSRLLFDSTSKLLEAKGVITHKDDLAKMIERERLAAQQQAAWFQTPLGQTLIIIRTNGFATEQEELAFANKLELEKIKTKLGEWTSSNATCTADLQIRSIGLPQEHLLEVAF